METFSHPKGRRRNVEKRIAVGMRFRPETHQKLVARALNDHRSITQTTEILIEQALSTEAALGGPELQRIVFNSVAAFGYNGAQRAAVKNLPAERWPTDPECYVFAAIAAMGELIKSGPDNIPASEWRTRF